ncbi:MAG: sugar ABC transporter permease [Bacilli bacterium]|nr:sugar ABC transporter permease [Bacilli bacterium]
MEETERKRARDVSSEAPAKEKRKPGKLRSYYQKNQKKVDSVIFATSFLIVPVILFIIFYIFVNVDSFLMAFRAQRTLGDGTVGEVWTIDNFKRIWTLLTDSDGAIIREALFNTVLFNIVNIFVTLPVTILVCYFFSKKIAGYRAFRAIFYLPCIIAGSALVVLFKFALGDGGPLDVLFRNSGYTYPLSSAPSAIITILIYNFLFGIGGNMIVISGAMHSINPQMIEAGRIDGCNWFQELIYIIFPSIWPTISTILILSVAGFLGASGPILPFTKGAHGTMTLSFYIFALVSGQGATQDLYLASAIGLIMTLISFPMALVVKKVVYGKEN